MDFDNCISLTVLRKTVKLALNAKTAKLKTERLTASASCDSHFCKSLVKYFLGGKKQIIST
jgi:hypothetical protein